MSKAILTLLFFSSSILYANDFPILMPKTSSTFLFDESINTQVGFAVNQNDSSLTDLFASTITNGVSSTTSNLCGPTTVANMMANLKFKNLDLALKFNPSEVGYTQQVREFFNSCHTDKASGTKVSNMRQCIYDTFIQNGFSNAEVSVIGPESLNVNPNPPPTFQKPFKVVDINDIRTALSQNYSIILDLKWYQFNELKKSWDVSNGHYIQVVGYDYDSTFGDSRIILKVINPEIDYMSRKDLLQRYDNVDMMKIPKKDGISYPADSAYVLDGYGFKGVLKRAFVRYLILSKPNN